MSLRREPLSSRSDAREIQRRSRRQSPFLPARTADSSPAKRSMSTAAAAWADALVAYNPRSRSAVVSREQQDGATFVTAPQQDQRTATRSRRKVTTAQGSRHFVKDRRKRGPVKPVEGHIVLGRLQIPPSPAGVRRSAVDADAGAGDVARRWRQQIDDRRRDFGFSSEPLQRDTWRQVVANKRRVLVFVGVQTLRRDRSGGDGVDTHTRFGPLGRRALAQRQHSAA